MTSRTITFALSQLRKVISLVLALTAASLGELTASPTVESVSQKTEMEAGSKVLALTGNSFSIPEEGILASLTSQPMFGTWWLPALALLIATILYYAYQSSRLGFYRKLGLGLQAQVIRGAEELSRHRSLIETQSQNIRAVTEKTQVELTRERERAEKAENIKENFVSALSHGVRTPLNALLGSTELLIHTNLTSEQQDYTRSIREAGDNILSSVNDIFEFYQIESGNVTLIATEFDLRDGVEEVLNLFAAKSEGMDFDLLYRVDPAIPERITADAYRLKQVLTNLIGSSIKFTEEKDYILVDVKLLERKDTSIKIGFEVQDTGVGIPYEKAMKFFKAGAQVDYSITNKFGGTGLGLTNCEYLMRLMGGTISMEANRGKGTSFSFAIDATVAGNAQTNLVDPSLAGKNILIVDNNPLSAQLLKDLLAGWNVDASSLPSGAMALRALSKGHNFDLILVDYRMPEVDGIEFMQSLKSSPYQVPSVLLGTPTGGEKSLAEAMFDAIVRKPIRRRELLTGLTTLTVRKNINMSNVTPETKFTVDFATKYPLRILVAEDDKTNQLLTGRVLAKLGYQSDMVGNGTDVLSAVAAKKYDIILMDVQMPEMNGMEATSRIRQMASKSQPVIIAMTALALSGDREECMRAGMDDYLSKPVELNDLLTLLEKWQHAKAKTKAQDISEA